MFDETQQKIIDATMNLIMERGYCAATTKEIAALAGINECTIFRKFKGKKEIILSAMTLPEWNPGLSSKDFTWQGDLEQDLLAFSSTYMKKVTPKMVRVSMGLRTPELYPDTAEEMLKIPQTLKRVLISYFREMHEKNKLANTEYESLAMAFLSLNFGFVFLKGSFGERLTSLSQKKYIQDSIHAFVNGI